MAKQFLATINGNLLSFPSGEVRMVLVNGVAVIDFNGANYNSNATLGALIDLANSGGTEQVQATILRVDDGRQTHPVYMSFPASKIQIENSTLSGSNSVINYNGVMYYAVETKAALVSAANTGGGSSLGYLVYTALLSQSGTSAPIATVLQKTLNGTVVWTRESAGVYIGTLAGTFPVAKTFITCGTTGGNTFTQAGNNETGEPSDAVYITTQDFNAVPTDGKLYYTPFEIRVYP